MKKCKMCHCAVKDDAAVCETCGTKLDPSLVKEVETTVVSAPPIAPVSPAAVKVSAGPGRGKKLCPKCQHVVGNRTFLCACGYAFSGSSETELPAATKAPIPDVKELEAPLPTPRFAFRDILTPTGSCPCKLESISESDVKDWRRRLLQHNPRLSEEAIRYYACTLFPMSREHPKGHPSLPIVTSIIHEVEAG